jgi:cellulose synthase/poly-beta-1,6-N-acetylglucosamine synthase-like glycosyltransferase
MPVAWQFVFWCSLIALAYTYVGYPALLWLLTRRRKRPEAPPLLPEALSVDVVLVVRNEAERIAARISNLLDCTYPGPLAILLVSDGSDDDTAERVRALNNPRVRVLALPENRGKSAGINAALAESTADILVFTDARQRFRKDTISLLVAHFAVPEVGAVSGALEVEARDGDAVGQGVDAYWRLEKKIRELEAVWDSSVGCTGAVYAARRCAVSPAPEDTILDDVVFPMGVALQGWRVLFDPAAIATDPQEFSGEKEARRKERTLGGNFQMLFRYPGWLLPWRNRLWWQLISHKHLRIVAPLFFVLALAANLALVGQPFYAILLAGHILFYLAALAGGLAGTSRRLPCFIRYPRTLVFLNVQVVRGLFRYLRGDFSRGWTNQQSPRQPAP